MVKLKLCFIYCEIYDIDFKVCNFLTRCPHFTMLGAVAYGAQLRSSDILWGDRIIGTYGSTGNVELPPKDQLHSKVLSAVFQKLSGFSEKVKQVKHFK